MSDFIAISSVDRREEMARLHKAAKNNVVQTSASPELEADGELQDQSGGKHKRQHGQQAAPGTTQTGAMDDGGLPDDEAPHSFDVTV